MRLICEVTEDIQVLTEAATATAPKKYFIEGKFIETNIFNRNKRKYPKELAEERVHAYDTNFISRNRALGELGHPEGPTVNLERVSHIIRSLKQEGNDFIGKAEIITENPYGKIAKNLIDIGSLLAVSTRAIGTVNESGIVQPDLFFAAVDIVHDPSAPNAFVDGMMEGKEWIWENGLLKESVISEIQKTIKKASSKQLQEAKINAFANFMKSLKH